MQEKQLKVGITGAKGHIGTTLREGLGAEFKIRSFTLSEESFESTAADLSNPSALSGSMPSSTLRPIQTQVAAGRAC